MVSVSSSICRIIEYRLKQIHPDRIKELHRRASRWYAENNVLSEAIIEALKANDILFVNELVSGNTLAIVEHNELLDVMRHFEDISDKEISQKPWFGVAYAWVKAYSEPTTGLDAILHQLECFLENVENASEKQRLIGHISAIRAYVAWVKGEAEKALEYTQTALANLPETDWTTRCNVFHTRGWVLQFLDRLPEAINSIERAIFAAQKTGRIQETFLPLTSLAYVYYLQGKLRLAFSVCEQILRVAEKSPWEVNRNPYLAYAYSTLSMVQFEWNEIDDALSNAQTGVDLAEKWNQADIIHLALNTLSNALCAAGDIDGALNSHQRAIRLAENVSPWYLMLSISNEIQLLLAKGDISTAIRRFADLEPRWDEKTSNTYLFTKALLQFEEGKMADLLTTLNEEMKELIKRGEILFFLRLLPLQALALYALGHLDEAVESIGCCLELAEPEGYVRIFIERGTPMLRLLRLAASRGGHTEYINLLLPVFKTSKTLYGVKVERTQKDIKSLALLEPLSEREQQVLRLLQSTMTSEEISRELFISVNTTRTHIRNIYSKLDVHGRIEAIRKAKELELI
jgi:LuxR family maltose regulon positive regulatory protein